MKVIYAIGNTEKHVGENSQNTDCLCLAVKIIWIEDKQ